MKEKSNLKIRINDGKVYTSYNCGEWLVSSYETLSDDMKLILKVLCSMDEYDVTIDAKKED